MAELTNKRVDVVLIFSYEKSPGEWTTKRSVLSDVRSTVTPEEILQVKEVFRGLAELELVHVEKVHYQMVI